MDGNTDKACDVEDEDVRFQHGLMSEYGPNIDVNRKFFKNTNGAYLMSKVKFLEKHNLDKFMRFIYMGKAMIDYASEGDLENFKRKITYLYSSLMSDNETTVHNKHCYQLIYTNRCRQSENIEYKGQ